MRAGTDPGAAHLGAKLNLHFHIHVVMTAGGLSLDGSRWIDLEQDVVAEQEALLAGRFKKLFLRKLRRLLKTQLFDTNGIRHRSRV